MSIDERKKLETGVTQEHNELQLYEINLLTGILIVAAFLAVTAAGGYGFFWLWTGYPGNTLWDWLKLLLIPVALTAATLYFSSDRNWRTEWKAAFALAVVFLLVTAVGGYVFNWNWTGFQGNHLWDWLKLVLQPVGLAALSIFFGANLKWRPELTVLTVAMAAFLAVSALGGYAFGWNWTGFQGNRLWEWINLLLLPVTLAVASISFKGYERAWATVLAIVAILLLVSAVGGYAFGWSWTGFRGNTLWDWFKLLLLPVALAAASLSFQGHEREWTKAAVAAGVFLLISAVGGYAFGWSWTGFQGNHLWDWLKLLVLPVALAAAQLTFKSDSGKKVPVTEAPTQEAPPEGATQDAASVEPVSADSAHLLTPSSTSASELTTPPAPRRRRGLLTALVALLIIVLVGSVLLAHFAPATTNVAHPAAPVAQVVGHAFFMSSGHGSGPNSLGANDKFQINLSHVANPSPGKSYYAWLLPDGNQSEIASIALGTLNVTNGTASLQSPYIDPQHTNLLDHFSRLLITEEGSNSVPLSYSLDKKTWRYYAEIPQTSASGECSGSMNQLSDLCHLRHLLSNDPELQQVNLLGGLNYWFLNNVEYVQKRAGEAVHRNVPAHIRNKVMDILSVLDGPQCIQQDLQQASSSALGVDNSPDDGTLNTFDTIPLRSCALTPSQPGYLLHIHNHLSALLQSSGVLADQVTLATQINAELNTINALLGQVQMDAQKLIGMDDHQLVHTNGHALLIDMEALTTRILNGGNDPTTNQPQPGVAQISSQIQQLATLDIKAYITTQ